MPALPPGAQANLDSLTVASGRSAWAAGSYRLGPVIGTLVLHWNGTRWRLLPSRNPGGARSGDASFMTAIAGRSCATIWAVGGYSTPTVTSHAATFRC